MQPFNVTIAPNRYFKETTLNITIWFLRGWNETDISNIEGTVVGSNLSPNTNWFPSLAYSYSLNPKYLHPGPTAGAYSIIVLENYQGFGVRLICSPRCICCSNNHGF